jgi:hypothetical protein
MTKSESGRLPSLLATVGTLVGLITGGLAIYKWLTVERAENRAAAAHIQIIGINGNSGYLDIAGGDVTTIELEIQNLGKRDAIDIKAVLFHQPGSSAGSNTTTDIEATHIPTVLSPLQSTKIEFMSYGSYHAVAKNFRFSNDPVKATLQRTIGATYQYRGSISWRDRGSNELATSAWCFEGREESFSNKVAEGVVKQRLKDAKGKREYSPVAFELNPCDPSLGK